MASLNVYAFTGNLGSDPELRTTTSGQTVCRLNVAVQRFGDHPPVWVDVSVWGKAAETCAQYLVKGRAVAINGRVDEVRAYMRKDGEPGASLSVSTSDVAFIGSRGDDAPAPSDLPMPSPSTAPTATNDEDIPF